MNCSVTLSEHVAITAVGLISAKAIFNAKLAVKTLNTPLDR